MAKPKTKKKPTNLLPWENVKNKLLGLVVAFSIMVVLLYINSLVIPPPTEMKTFPELALENKTPSVIKFRDADIVFQQTAGDLAEHISGVTGSPLTHCGLIVIQGKDVLVLEAGNKVVLTPVEEWIQRGVDKKFALLRDSELTLKQQGKIVAMGKRFLGKPYDYQYEWDDSKIYCSELVFKAYERVNGEKLGELVPLKSLKYQGHEEFIRSLMKGELPLERMIITPDSIYRSEKLKKIYDDFKLYN